jgi:hypothetical protein
VSLAEELEAVAERAAGLAAPGEAVAAVLPAEAQPGARVYLVAFHGDEAGRTWIALDGGGGVLRDRSAVREAVSIAALCEVAAETAAGGDLDELLAHLRALRLTESPGGIEEAEEAARALQRTIGAPPQLATPARLDEIGAATRRLEQALDAMAGSPFAAGMRSAAAAVEELTREVEATYRVPFG